MAIQMHVVLFLDFEAGPRTTVSSVFKNYM
jgi:hypothetical protein